MKRLTIGVGAAILVGLFVAVVRLSAAETKAANLSLTAEQAAAIDRIAERYRAELSELTDEIRDIDAILADRDAAGEPGSDAWRELHDEAAALHDEKRHAVESMRAEVAEVLTDAQREHFAGACPWAIRSIHDGDRNADRAIDVRRIDPARLI